MSSRSAKELEGDTKRAVQILELFTDPSKGRDVKTLIPPSVLREAHGLVLIRLYRIGFMLSAKSGSGIIIARNPDGSWSAPSGVSISSLGFGHQAGGEMIDSIIVMNYRAAVKAFFDGGGQLQLGVGASLAAGPFGRAADVSASASSGNYIAATYAYSQSKGLYAGYSFEGSKISERVNTNKAFYQRPITAREILTGDVPPPMMAARLYQILDSIGAGARPGLPFTPKKSMVNSPSYSQAQPLQEKPRQQQPQPQPQPQQQQQNRPADSQGFEEPPPPYVQLSLDDTNATESSSTPAVPPVNTFTYPPPSKNTVVTGGAGGERAINENKKLPDFNVEHKPDSYDTNQAGESSSYIPPPPLQPNTSASSSSAGPEIVPVMNSTTSKPIPASAYPKDVKHPIPSDNENQMSVVVAKYDYEASQPTDLSFHAGDHIIVTKRLDDRQCWWEGEIGNKVGFFPANYTDDIDD